MFKKLIFFLIIVFCLFSVLFFLGWQKNFFRTISCYDKLLHFSAGFFVLLTAWWFVEILEKAKKINKKSFAFKFLISFLILVSISILWEVFEFTTDRLFNFPILQESFSDTVWDLIFDLGGGILCALILYFPFKRKYSIIKML